MAKTKTSGSEAPPSTLPEPTTWARAVVLATGIFGIALAERTLSQRSVDDLGRRVAEIVRPLHVAARKLVEALSSRLPDLGVDLDCDRMRTAQSGLLLCEALLGRSSREVVEVLAHARLSTSSSAVQASLASAGEAVDSLEDPLVQGVLRQLAGRERMDLSASKYLREARAILRQDEMRRSLSVELRMVAGAAQAYLLSGTPSDGVSPAATEAESTMPKSMAMASVVAPAEVRIESTRGSSPPPPPQSSARPKAKANRSALSKTLASEGVVAPVRVGVERRGSVPDRNAARAQLAEVMREAEQKLMASKGPVLLTVLVTLDVEGG